MSDEFVQVTGRSRRADQTGIAEVHQGRAENLSVVSICATKFLSTLRVATGLDVTRESGLDSYFRQQSRPSGARCANRTPRC